jgi:hypothetical protein
LIALLAQDLQLIDCVLYGPQRTDVSQGRRPDGANLIATFTTPSPGAGNYNSTNQNLPVLNEVLANNQSFTNAAGRTPDWVELYNNGTNAIDLADFSLTDDAGTPRKWVFPTNSLIAAGGRRVIEFDDATPVSATNTGFGLSADGDGVYLFKRPADGGSVLDSVSFGLQAADFSIGRLSDGTGSWALTLPTRGTANVAAGLGNASALKINEWMANPTSGDDWLELYNPNPQPVAMATLALTDNASVRDKSPFPALSYLGPYAFQKMVADGNPGSGANHANFNLNSSSGFIGLYWPNGTQIDAVSYGAQTAGVSEGRLTDGAATIASFPETASPGAPNYLLLTNLVINEVLSHTDPPLEDAVEIRNVSSNAVDIGGWYLSNEDGNLRKYFVPAGTVVAANSFKVFYEYQFGTNATTNALAPFNFNSAHGDTAQLAQADGSGNLTGYRARVTFGAAANGVSFGRFLTSAGPEFVALSHRSFGVDNPSTLAQFRTGTGATNPYPLVGPVVISEIHYRPASGYSGDTNAAEFLELLNPGTNAVQLFDPNATTNTWRMAGGAEFTFPANQTLAAGKTLVLVSFDPVANPVQLAWFQTNYNLATNVLVLGPFAGTLANEGDDLELLKPDPPQPPPHPDAGFVPYVLVEHVHYLPAAPWPTNGLGTGSSLQRIAAATFGNEPLNWFAAAPSAGQAGSDADSDGLPDDWEIANSLNPNDPTGVNGANGDPDGDGQINIREYQAGTNPRDATDYLRFLSVERNAGVVSMLFHAAAGHSYSVLRRDELPTGSWSSLTNLPVAAVAGTVEVFDPNPAGARRFYRLVTPAWP